MCTFPTEIPDSVLFIVKLCRPDLPPNPQTLVCYIEKTVGGIKQEMAL